LANIGDRGGANGNVMAPDDDSGSVLLPSSHETFCGVLPITEGEDPASCEVEDEEVTLPGEFGLIFFADAVDPPVARSTTQQEDDTMQYLLLIYENEKRFAKGYDPAEMAEYGAFGKEFAKAIVGGNALQPTTAATTVRLRDGKRLTTDGPFAETKEQLGGYYLIEARDLDEAIGVAGKIPAARFGSIEVRPIMKFD
jgi:hypothetical protein